MQLINHDATHLVPVSFHDLSSMRSAKQAYRERKSNGCEYVPRSGKEPGSVIQDEHIVAGEELGGEMCWQKSQYELCRPLWDVMAVGAILVAVMGARSFVWI